MSHFFIRRPIFAIVLSLIIMLAGGIAVFKLPVEQFPPVSPPVVQIAATFPGASAETLQNTVIQVIEQQMSAIDNLLYMSSISDDTGQSTTTLTFAPGTDPDIAQVQVQNKLQSATSRLPAEVQQSGLRVTKSTSDFLMVAGFVSDDNSMSKFDISNYVASNIQDPLSRIPGVGSMNLFGTQYAMRIWLDPVKLTSYALTPLDVNQAIQTQNVQISGGQLGGSPSVQGQTLSATISEATLLRTPEQFARILLKVQPDGARVRLGDVARIALGPENYNVDVRYNGKSASGLGIQLAPGANALATAAAVRARLVELAPYFPHGLRVVYPNDVTPFIEVSIHEVVKTLIEGILLVFLVMYLFLQNVRATLIPSITVPVVLLGTFGVMSAMGFTINTLSMFGLVLAIGLLVDDAIVVVENVERHMEEGMSPVAAAQRSMNEVGFALVAIALVLVAVFVPTAFIDGISGMFYRQFAVTIAASTVISALVSLTLSPALAALLLKPQHDANSLGARWMAIFNRGFSRLTGGYVRLTGRILSRRWLMLPVYLALAGLTLWRLDVTPRGFVPQLDRGYAIVSIQLPAGSTLARTSEVVQDATARLMSHPGVAHTAAFVGTDGATFTSAPNTAVIFTMFKDFGARASGGLDGPAMLGALRGKLAPISAARVMVIPPPSVPGIGTGGGFKLMLRDTGGLGPQALQAAARGIVEEAAKLPSVMGAFTPYNAMSPQIKVELDRTKAEYLGVPLLRVNETLQSYMAPVFVNDMNLMGRVWRVTAQADAPYRRSVADLAALKTRAANGDMVPLGSVATFSEGTAPFRVPRYNLYPAAEIQGSTKPGYSTGQTIAAMEALLKARLPAGFDYEWTELALQEKHAGGSTGMVLGLAVLLVYLLLAALFESWLLPLSVVLIVPSCVLATLVGVSWRGMDNNVLTQISIVVLIGLAAKNAILIVEFARQAMAAGADAREAAIAAARTRLRPILMTSLAFLLGAIPLMLSSGPGAEMRQSMGTAVFAGMLGVTLSGLLFTPLFFTLLSRRRAAPAARTVALGEAA